jgi:hypothetical protein
MSTSRRMFRRRQAGETSGAIKGGPSGAQQGFT